jgi:hypothetical protein
MKTPFNSSPSASHRAPHKAFPDQEYASADETSALLAAGIRYRKERMEAADMITTDEAAALAGASRVTVNAWIKSFRCIGLAHLRRGFKLPVWQFEPAIWPLLQPLARQLGARDGWQLLSFLESAHEALGGRTPRMALEQGESPEMILELAKAEGY